MEIDGLGQSLYFNAAQLAGQSAVKSNKSSDSQKTAKASKKKFASALEQSRAEYELVQDGFPAEIATMEIEEAVVFLKDEADYAVEDRFFIETIINSSVNMKFLNMQHSTSVNMSM